MTTQNNTQEIVTKLGSKFVLRTGITYGQHRELLDVYLNEKEGTLKGETVGLADRKSFEFVVVSIDGETEGLYEKCKQMSYTDVRPVFLAIKEAISPKE